MLDPPDDFWQGSHHLSSAASRALSLMAVNLKSRLSTKPFRSATDSYVAYEWIDRRNDMHSRARGCSGTTLVLETQSLD